MNKKIIMITALVFLVSLILSLLFFSKQDLGDLTNTIEFNESYSLSNITDLHLDVVETDIFIEKGEGEKIYISHNGSCSFVNFDEEIPSGEHTLLITQDKTKTNIQMNQIEWERFFTITNCNDKITIVVPLNFSQDLTLKTVSGDIEAMVDLNILEVSSVSGNQLLLGGNNVLLESVSGDIEIGSINKGSIETVSGNIRIDSINEGNINTISGDIELKLSENQSISYDTVSGDVTGDIRLKEEASIHIETVSGDIQIK